MFLLCVLSKDRCTRKSEDLQIIKEANNVLMTIAKMTTVALVENHHDLLIADILKMLIVIVLCNGTIQLLDSGNDNL